MKTNTIKEIKTGVIGTGSMGSNHVRLLKELSCLIGVNDLDETSGNKVADKFDTLFFMNMADLVKKIDAVVVAVPTKYHLQIIKEIVNINPSINILVEKPLAHSVEECLEFCILPNEKNICVGHIERFNPMIVEIKKLLNGEKIGKILSIYTRRISPNPLRITDVGVVMDLAIHDIDIINSIVGDSIQNIFSSCHRNDLGLDIHSNILIEFDQGTKGICEVSWNSPKKIREINILCENVLIEGDFALQELKITKQNPKLECGFETHFIEVKKEEPLKLELQNFLESTTSGKNLGVTISEAKEAVVIASKIISERN